MGGIFRNRSRDLAIGVVAHIIYLLWIGAVFMSGRFFTPVLLVSVVLIVTHNSRKQLQPAIVLLLLVSLFTPASPLWARWYDEPSPDEPAGVVDEREHYVGNTGLFKVIGNGGQPLPGSTEKGRVHRAERPKVVAEYSIGITGYYAGPGVHIVDRQALADPLLPRLPAATGLVWRQGHYTRSLPRGYIETIWQGENRAESEKLAELFDVVSLITRADLWDPERLAAIVSMNLGLYGDLVEPAPQISTFDVADALAEVAEKDPDLIGSSPDRTKESGLMVVADYYTKKGVLGRAAAAWGTGQHMGASGDHVWQAGLRLAHALHERDQGRLAMKIYGVCMPNLAEDREAHVDFARVLFSQGVFKDAAAEAKKGFSFDDPQVAPLRIIADVMRIRRIPEAEVNYNAILQLDPGNEHAQRELLAIEREKGNGMQ